ncbi:MAG: YfhO family protein [Gemmatimonadales bacterium]
MEEQEQGANVILDEPAAPLTSPALARPPVPPVTRQAVGEAGPQRGGWWAALFYAACTLSLGYPALAGKFLAGPNSDQFVAGYAFREFGASVLRETGGFAQWNPYIFGGMPYIAAMHGDIFYPTFLLRMAMPTDAAMTWSLIAHLFLAGLFTWFFLRRSGFGFYPALIGGVAYMMSGQLASLVSPGHDGKLSVSALFPLTLWMLTLGMRQGRRWTWGVLALTIGLAVLSPHPQLLQYLLLASGAFTLHLTVSLLRSRDVEWQKVLARMGFALGAVAIGLAIGAVQYLPVREYVAWSPRAGGLADYATATSYAWPTKELFDAYLPQFTGMIDAYWGENAIHLHSDYVGAVVLLLAGAAFSRLRSDPRRGFILFWTVTLVIALLWALGGHTPFYRIPYAIIPGTKYFRAPATVFFVGTMALSVLAATGAERVLTRDAGLKYGIGWLVFATAVVAMALTEVLTDFAQALAAEDMVDTVIANAHAVVLGAWRSFAFVLLALGVIVLHRKGRIRLAAVGWSLAVLVAADSWTIMRQYWIFSPPASVTYKSDAAIDRIKKDPQPARVIALEIEPNERRDANLQGDGLMAYRIRNVLGYHGNELGRYDQLLQKDQSYQQIFNPRVWQILNVRYLLTNSADVGAFFPGAEWIIGPVKDAAGTDIYLYRLPGENPYAWVTPVIVKAEDASVEVTLLNRAFDVRTAALFAPEADVTGLDNLVALPLPIDLPATVTHYEPGKASIELSSPAPAGAALMVSENYFPGWSATVDGKPARIGRADYSLIGVQLPEGGKNIVLTFEDPAYRLGKLITLLALMVVAGLIVWGILMQRKVLV